MLSASGIEPQRRKDFFQGLLANQDYRCVGWHGTVSAVTDTQQGRKVELLVRPWLVTKGGGPAFTPLAYKETWRIDDQGQLTLEKSEAGGGLAIMMTD